MNKEIKEIKWPGQILDYVDTKEHLVELFNYITNLQEENELLKNRIDKAIEYIKSYLPNYSFDHYDLEKLLNILRGDKNDNGRL